MSTEYQWEADALYALSIRPQEWDLDREAVQWQLRYAPIFDEPVPVTTEHFKVLVIEARLARVADPALERMGVDEIEVLKAGWQVQVRTADPVAADQVPEPDDEMPQLLAKLAASVNRLAEEAGLEPLMDAAVQQRLIGRYRERFGSVEKPE